MRNPVKTAYTTIFLGITLCLTNFPSFAADEDDSLSLADEENSTSNTMKIEVDEKVHADAVSKDAAIASGAANAANAAIDHTVLDQKRAKLREQLKRDRADSKRARSIRRNAELNKDGLSLEEQALKKKLDYARSQEEGDGSSGNSPQQATDSAKKFSQWVNDNMMINKDKNKSTKTKESEKILEEAKSAESAEDLLY